MIGYFASWQMQAVCDGDGCIIAGSLEKMRRIVQRLDRGVQRYRFCRTTFTEIQGGLEMGGAYCFDEEAYGRFLTPAQAAGIRLEAQDFSDPGPTGIHLVRIQLGPNRHSFPSL